MVLFIEIELDCCLRVSVDWYKMVSEQQSSNGESNYLDPPVFFKFNLVTRNSGGRLRVLTRE